MTKTTPAIEMPAPIAHLGQITDSGFAPSNVSEQGYTWLSQCGLLKIAGPDAERFLQGQLTCDVSKLSANEWQLGACCNAKGRMVANFVIARQQQTFLLRLPREQVSHLLQHLSKYAVFFKAELIDVSHDWLVMAHTHQDGQANQLDIADDIWTLQWPHRCEYWLPATAAAQQMSDQPLTYEQTWRLADIQQGLVWVTASTLEYWIPQNIDWHQQGGVSFSKGCYTGQEIVARLQYLGKAKKGLFWLKSPTDLTVDVLAPVEADGKTLGEVCAWEKNTGLAWLSVDAPNTAKIEQGPITLQSLTYTEDVNTNDVE